MKCRVEGCERQSVYPDQARCEAHRIRWSVVQPEQQPTQPAWLRRMRAVGLPAKDMTGSPA